VEKKNDNGTAKDDSSTDPRWSAVLAGLAIGGLYYALPERFSAGPSWLLLVVIVALLIPSVWAHHTGHDRMNYYLGMVLSAIITGAMIWSLTLLIFGLLEKRESPTDLLRGAAALWLTNILVFASWYWRLDAGGPNRRDIRAFHTEGDFLFPQMTLPRSLSAAKKSWKPDFVDYLFLAFNTSTAFSPTDVPVLSRWAKILMMIQSVISLGTIALLAARAVNIL
jgi:hypothetical protein